MIKNYEFYHGVVFSRLLNSLDKDIAIIPRPSGVSETYVLKGVANTAGVYIKYSTKRMSPWRFTMLEKHQNELRLIKEQYGQIFLILVCGQNGIAVLNYDELKKILDHNYEPAEWISVARKKREMYRIEGKDGALDFKIGESDFPGKILNYLNGEVMDSANLDKLHNNFISHALVESV